MRTYTNYAFTDMIYCSATANTGCGKLTSFFYMKLTCRTLYMGAKLLSSYPPLEKVPQYWLDDFFVNQINLTANTYLHCKICHHIVRKLKVNEWKKYQHNHIEIISQMYIMVTFIVHGVYLKPLLLNWEGSTLFGGIQAFSGVPQKRLKLLLRVLENWSWWSHCLEVLQFNCNQNRDKFLLSCILQPTPISFKVKFKVYMIEDMRQYKICFLISKALTQTKTFLILLKWSYMPLHLPGICSSVDCVLSFDSYKMEDKQKRKSVQM
jgi:hypothetical protein